MRAIVTTREAGSGGRESLQHVVDVRTNDALADVKLQGSDTSTLVSPRSA
ncbi:Thymidylate kinase (dTMP kinase) (fragment) [Bradyrhizobium sp. ORS 375]